VTSHKPLATPHSPLRQGDTLTAGQLKAAQRDRPTRLLLERIERAGLPAPVREYQFVPDRRWRFDLAWPDRRIAVELEGGVWIRGAHTRGRGYEKDLAKYNRAGILGWTLIRMTPRQALRPESLEMIRAALARGEWPVAGEQ
jgi:hypothetical protein